jgi:Ca-activated chloride channel family protein
MKAQSFEYELRHTNPPAPDPEARLRARRAALEEFERVHAPMSASASAPERKGFLASLRWAPASALWGGLATACIVVIGVSVVWLMPPEQRQVQLHRTELSPPPSTPAAQVGRQNEASSVPAAQSGRRADASSVTAAQSKRETANASAERATPNAQPQREHKKAPVARAPQSATPTTNPVPAPTHNAPPPGLVAIDPSSRSAPPSTEEVVVTGNRIEMHSMTSPMAVIGGQLDEAVVTQAPQSEALRVQVYPKLASASIISLPPTPPEVGRDKFQHFDTNPVKRVSDDPVSTFSMDVDTASYSFVRRKLNEGVLPQPDAVRVEEMINYFDYAWPAADSRDQPFKPTVVVSDSPWGEGKKLIHIGIKGYALPVRQQPDVNLVLLLDVSGSMNSPDKLPLAQRSMALLLDTLKPTDTVAIVVYAGAAGQVLPPTPVKDKETILQALNALRPGGSTAGAEGIRLAYQLAEKSFRKEGVNRILLATDGDFNVGITDQNELKGFIEREREKGVYLSVLGFGEGNYRDEMAQTLAQNGNGVAAYIDTLNEAKKVLVQESTAALFPIAKDVKLQIEFNPVTVAEYRLVGYETRALNREDFNNDKVDAGDVGSGHTVTAIYEITPVGSKAQLIDERRYAGAAADSQGKSSEYGFLKIRYKLPNSSHSRLIEQPILMDARAPASVTDDVKFSTAVAGFAQLLRGGKYTGSLSFEDVVSEAQASIGNDPYGYRAELVDLARKAQRARGM